jgi:hypothetical protein
MSTISVNEVFLKLTNYLTEVIDNKKCSTLTSEQFYTEFKEKFKLGFIVSSSIDYTFKARILTLLNIFFNNPKNKSYIIDLCNDTSRNTQEKVIAIVMYILTILHNKLKMSESGDKPNPDFDENLRRQLYDSITKNAMADNIVNSLDMWIEYSSTLQGGKLRRNKTRKNNPRKNKTRKYKYKNKYRKY